MNVSRPASRMIQALARTLATLVVITLAAQPADARVVRVVIDARQDVANGQAFGDAGPYERLVGRVYYAFDPANPHDRQVVDLGLAPRNARGEVEAWGDFVMFRPKDPKRGNGVALVDVTNRGNQTTFVFHLNARRDLPPDAPEYLGDALLLQRGLTVVAIGWQFDLPGEPAYLLRFHPPAAGDAAHPTTGLVRSDVTIESPTDTISLGHGVGASRALAYPVADPDDPANVLTVRDLPAGDRTIVPRAAWRFARKEQDGSVVADPRSVYMASGFTPGRIYEMVYRAKDPVVVGTGLAAIRDFISYLKHDPASIAPVKYGIAYGVSQTGRLLRHFLYQGFNADEQGRRAFDGIFAHTAGAGRGSFNHRFAQPSRDAQPFSTFFYPTDLFPFTSEEEADPVTGARDALLAHEGPAEVRPKVFFVDGGYEYWGRAASLTHTTPDGSRDIGFPPDARRYVFASAQHSSPAPFPPPEASRLSGPVTAWRGSTLDQRLALRALMMALVDWVGNGKLPPPSQYPTLAAKQLVQAGDVTFPTIGHLPVARVPYQPYRMEFGPRWPEGIIDIEPPKLGAPYTVLVPRVDEFGNDLGGIRSIELRVPLATYFPWHLRTAAPTARDRLVSFSGTFVPLARTDAEREQAGDSRPSIATLYTGREQFLRKVDAAAQDLVKERFLLPHDVTAARQRMADIWDWINAR